MRQNHQLQVLSQENQVAGMPTVLEPDRPRVSSDRPRVNWAKGQGAGCKQKKLQESTIHADDTLATLNHNLPPEDHSTTFKSALGLDLKENHLVRRKDLDLGNHWSDQAETCYQAGPYVLNDGPAVES